jgi:hypothetical protein
MMQEGQVRFSGEDRFNTFESKQMFLFSTNKTNKLDDTVVIVGDSEKSTYYLGIPLIKNLLISDNITLRPDGQIKVSQ